MQERPETRSANSFPVPKVSIRKAEICDVTAVKKIADDSKKLVGFVRRAALEESARNENLLVMETPCKCIIGFCNYRRRRDDVFVIYEVCLFPEFTHLGLGGLFIKELGRPIRAKCPVDNYSNGFYSKMGFTLMATEPGRGRALNVWELHN